MLVAFLSCVLCRLDRVFVCHVAAGFPRFPTSPMIHASVSVLFCH